MSNWKVANTTLKWHDGPFYPPVLEKLHELLYLTTPGLSLKHNNLLEICEHSSGRFVLEQYTATDDYSWFASFVEKIYAKSSIVIALPWLHYLSQSEGSPCDRHTALFTRGSISVAERELSVQSLIGFVENWLDVRCEMF